MLFEKKMCLKISENVSLNRFGYVGTYLKETQRRITATSSLHKVPTSQLGVPPIHQFSGHIFQDDVNVFSLASEIYFMVRTLNVQHLDDEDKYCSSHNTYYAVTKNICAQYSLKPTL